MKLSYCCPKCNNSNIAIMKPRRFGSDMYHAISIGFSRVIPTRYICTDCGYMEMYINDTKGLAKIKDKYLHNDSSDGFV